MKFVVIFYVAFICLVSVNAQMAGDLGPETEATQEMQGYATQLRRKIETIAREKFRSFRVIAFRTRTADENDIFMKIKIDYKEHIHVRIYKAPSGSVTMTGVQVDKPKEDPIEYF